MTYATGSCLCQGRLGLSRWFHRETAERTRLRPAIHANALRLFHLCQVASRRPFTLWPGRSGPSPWADCQRTQLAGHSRHDVGNCNSRGIRSNGPVSVVCCPLRLLVPTPPRPNLGTRRCYFLGCRVDSLPLAHTSFGRGLFHRLSNSQSDVRLSLLSPSKRVPPPPYGKQGKGDAQPA